MLLKIRIFLTIAIALAFCGDVARVAAESHPMAPRLSFTSLSGGKITLDEFKGSVVLLNFWTTSCGVCLSEIPTLSSLQDSYASQGLRVVGVAVDDNVDSIRKVAEQRHVNYTVASGDNQMEEQFGADGFPVTLVIGRDGRIYSRHSGAVSREAIESEVAQLLRAGPDTPVEQFRASAGENVRLLSPAELQSEIPGVDLSAFSQAQKAELKQQLASQACPCGCNRTVLMCRSTHSSCKQSKEMAQQAAEKLHAPMI